jgi:hypothetical protein
VGGGVGADATDAAGGATLAGGGVTVSASDGSEASCKTALPIAVQPDRVSNPTELANNQPIIRIMTVPEECSKGRTYGKQAMTLLSLSHQH